MFNTISKLFKSLSSFYINQGNQSIYGIEAAFSNLSDDELKARCKTLYDGGSLNLISDEHTGLKVYLLSFVEKILRRFALKSYINNQTIEQVAAAVEVFKRAPADLPKGSILFPQQVSAAVALTQRCLVQMDTGEGKTYAILPAAFSLICQYRKVYIICANNYLAERDARRTQRFWNFLGIEVGWCKRGDGLDNEWQCPVVYTTLDALLACHLKNETYDAVAPYPINFGALILDEADAVLLDETRGHSNIVIMIKSEIFDWSFALEFAGELKKGLHIIEYYERLYATLTVEGEALLKARLKADFGSTENYLMLRDAVENAYAALFLAKKGVHYVIKDSKVHSIDLLSGKINYDSVSSWIYPLEHALKFPPRVETFTIHSLAIGNFIRLFDHISGTSGSILDDITDYVFSYMLFTIIIPPRKQKYKGQKLDSIYKTKREAKAGLVAGAILEAEKGRAILIGTQNINDAEELFVQLSNEPKLFEYSIRLVTATNLEVGADAFATAGQEGVITVATQLAGRGVDIRISDAVRERGGLALLCLEHSLMMRHDKQFLGRAGRQGDPFSAEFYVSLEDELMVRFGSERISQMMTKFGYKEGETIKHSMVDNSILRAQRKNRDNSFILKATSGLIERAEKEVYDSVSIWINQLKAFADRNDPATQMEFIKWLIDKYLVESVQMFVPSKKNLSYDDCSKIRNKIREELGIDINTVDIEDRERTVALSRLGEKIRESLGVIIEESRNNLEELKDYLERNEHDLDLLNDILNRLNKAYGKVKSLFPVPQPERQSVSKDEQVVEDELIVEEKEVSMDVPVQAGGQADPDKNDLFHLHEPDLSLIKYLQDVNRLLKLSYGSRLNEIVFRIAHKRFGVTDGQELLQLIKSLFDGSAVFRERMLGKGRKVYQEYNEALGRRPFSIAYWSIFKPWSECLKQDERDKLRLRQSNYSNLDYYRKACDEILNNWERVEAHLAPDILKNLLRAGNPDLLKDLFVYHYNTVEVDDPGTNQERDDSWKHSKVKLEIADQKSNVVPVSGIINQFIQANEKSIILGEYTIAVVQQTLSRFLDLAPIATLRSREKILEAILAWQRAEMDASVLKKRRSINRRWVLLFLKYLSGQNIIGRLPSIRTRFKSNLQRFKKNLYDLKTVVSMLRPFLFLVVFITLSAAGRWMQPRQMGGWYLYLDYILFGGLLSAGAVTAACFFSTMARKVFANLYVSVFALVFAAGFVIWWQLNWSPYSFNALVTNIMLFILAAFLVSRTIAVDDSTKLSTDISLTAGWMSYCIFFVFIPRIYGWKSEEIAALLLLFIAYYYWRAKVNYEELTVLSSLTNDNVILNSEYVRSSLKTEGSIGYMPHLYAGISSLSVFVLLNTGLIRDALPANFATIRTIVAAIVYLVVLIIIIRATLKTRLSLALWQSTLNSRHVVLIDGSKQDTIVELDLAVELKRKFNILVLREFLFQFCLTALLFYLYWSFLPGLGIPGFLIMPAIYLIFSENAYNLCEQLFKVLISRAPASFEQLDFSNTRYDDKEFFFKKKFNSVRFVKKFFIYTSVFFTVLKGIIDLFTNSKDVINFFKNLFH